MIDVYLVYMNDELRLQPSAFSLQVVLSAQSQRNSAPKYQTEPT